jgi:hypothetical protein
MELIDLHQFATKPHAELLGNLLLVLIKKSYHHNCNLISLKLQQGCNRLSLITKYSVIFNTNKTNPLPKT